MICRRRAYLLKSSRPSQYPFPTVSRVHTSPSAFCVHISSGALNPLSVRLIYSCANETSQVSHPELAANKIILGAIQARQRSFGSRPSVVSDADNASCRELPDDSAQPAAALTVAEVDPAAVDALEAVAIIAIETARIAQAEAEKAFADAEIAKRKASQARALLLSNPNSCPELEGASLDLDGKGLNPMARVTLRKPSSSQKIYSRRGSVAGPVIEEGNEMERPSGDLSIRRDDAPASEGAESFSAEHIEGNGQSAFPLPVSACNVSKPHTTAPLPDSCDAPAPAAASSWPVDSAEPMADSALSSASVIAASAETPPPSPPEELPRSTSRPLEDTGASRNRGAPSGASASAAVLNDSRRSNRSSTSILVSGGRARIASPMPQQSIRFAMPRLSSWGDTGQEGSIGRASRCSVLGRASTTPGTHACACSLHFSALVPLSCHVELSNWTNSVHFL